MRFINRIVIHCTATPNGKSYPIETIRQWHRERGFKEVGYHYVIDYDGNVLRGRKESQVGAHAAGFNANSIGVCLEGGVGGKDKLNPGVYSEAQFNALRELVDDLVARYPTVESVDGHRDLSPDIDGDGEVEPSEWIKLCPGFDVTYWYANRYMKWGV